MSNFRACINIFLTLNLMCASAGLMAANYKFTFYDVPKVHIDTFKKVRDNCIKGHYQEVGLSCMKAGLAENLPKGSASSVYIMAIYLYETKSYNRARTWLQKVMDHPKATKRQKADAAKKLQSIQ